MLKRDDKGRIADDSYDFGDSANRSGLWVMMGNNDIQLGDFVTGKGAVRHPKQAPWNNPKNFTRDQLQPLLAGLMKLEETGLNRILFWQHFRRFFFCQNSERDVVGSTKYPYPHSFINDKGVKETRYFDSADILMPWDIWIFLKSCKYKYLGFLDLIGAPLFLLSLWAYCRFNTNKDEGQMIAQCYIAGHKYMRLYCKWRDNYESKLIGYWANRRNQEEIAIGLIRLLDSY